MKKENWVASEDAKYFMHRLNIDIDRSTNDG